MLYRRLGGLTLSWTRNTKVGAEFISFSNPTSDIATTNQCAAGFSSTDEYRIVQTRRQSDPEEPRDYFDLPWDNGSLFVALWFVSGV